MKFRFSLRTLMIVVILLATIATLAKLQYDTNRELSQCRARLHVVEEQLNMRVASCPDCGDLMWQYRFGKEDDWHPLEARKAGDPPLDKIPVSAHSYHNYQLSFPFH